MLPPFFSRAKTLLAKTPGRLLDSQFIQQTFDKFYLPLFRELEQTLAAFTSFLGCKALGDKDRKPVTRICVHVKYL